VGALLHDVGKMKVPSEILNKPTHLTEQEFAMMKSHVPEGVKILEKSAGIRPLSIEVAARHHERYGGGGYVAGLSGDELPGAVRHETTLRGRKSSLSVWSVPDASKLPVDRLRR